MIRLPKFFILLLAIVCVGGMASAQGTYAVGDLSYDQISGSDNEFDITNLTGSNAFPSAFPITSLLTFSVTNLVVNFTSGPALTLPGSDFTVVDIAGDVDCAAGPCNLFGDNITSAVLTGTFSPTTGLSGLTLPDTGILAAFSTTITPGCGTSTLDAGCDTAIINATGNGGGISATPEPGAFSLICVGVLLIGIMRVARRPGSGRISA
jgi:hypothetical protein